MCSDLRLWSFIIFMLLFGGLSDKVFIQLRLIDADRERIVTALETGAVDNG